MNSDIGYPVSSKRRSNNSEEESGMDSGHSVPPTLSLELPSVKTAALLKYNKNFSHLFVYARAVKVPHQQLSPFNAPVHVLHDPRKTLAIQQPVSTFPLRFQTWNHEGDLPPITLTSFHSLISNPSQSYFTHPLTSLKAALEGSQHSQAQPSSHYPFNAPAHFLHAPSTKKAPTQAGKPAMTSKQFQRSQAEDIDHYAHATPEEEIANTLRTVSAATRMSQVTSKRKAKQPVKQAAKPTPSKASQPSPIHHDPFNVPAHLIHAAGTTKAPAHTPKPNAAADHRQTRPEDTDHYAHPTPKEEIAHQQHVENRQRGNSVGHHAIAVPAHRPHKPRRNHLASDETDKHDHFRHQPYDQTCGIDYHVELGNLRSSAASDSPLLSVRKLFSAANSSVLKGYTYSEAVTHTIHHPRQNLEERRQNINISTPEMNLGAWPRILVPPLLNIRSQEIRTSLSHMPSHHASGPSTPLLQDQPSKKERKQAQKQKRQAYRKFRKSQATVSAAYKADGGALEENVFSEAVKHHHSKHHAPYPDSLDAHQHGHHHHQSHAHTADHTHADAGHDGQADGQAAAKNVRKSGHTHISDYQEQLHHHHHYDPTTQNQL
ncbi:hypothetical protein BGX30_011244 [Mortierella sp. GBA39]|nr:hypothetical protein BGX30_011244 [Mortierella sp. GBA39]